MATRKTKKFEDVTVELNYSQAIRNQIKFPFLIQYETE